MKKIYRYNRKGHEMYFTTLKKSFKFAHERGASLHKHYAAFKRWYDKDNFYELDLGGMIDDIIVQ